MSILFLNSTFKGSTEAHWTAVLSIGFVYSLYHFAEGKERFTRHLLRFGGATVVIFLLARLWLAIDVIPLPKALHSQFEHREWTQDLVKRAGDRTIVFENSYRDASLIRFYTGHPAWTFTNIHYRPSQYDLRAEQGKALHLKDVFYVGNSYWNHPEKQEITYGKRRYGVAPIDNFPVLEDMQIYWSANDWQAGKTEQQLQLTFYNPNPDTLHWDHPGADLKLTLLIEKGIENWAFIDIPYPQMRAIPPDSSRIQVQVPWDNAHCPIEALGFGFRMGNLGAVLQSELLAVKCE